jgi:hypothetical protein
VSFGDQVSGDPDVECDILLALLATGDNESEVCQSLTDRAQALGLRAVVSGDEGPVIVRVEGRHPGR